jgi:DNA-binding transcriptional ArsR family regulator
MMLDDVFAVLADPTRRAVVRRLGEGPASVSDLAAPFSMKLPSFLKHVRVLEACGVIRTRKHGRVRTCSLEQGRLEAATSWLEEQRRIWEAATDRLEAFVTDQQEETPSTPSST